MREISYCEALKEATAQEMERDSGVFVYGIGVPSHAKIFGSTDGLVEKFGPERCFDTPLCEETMTGFGLGAAVNGMRPIHIHIRVDFLLLAMNQLVNMVSNFAYSTGGKVKVPLVIRAVVGRGWGQGCQHSKSLHSYFAHIPGLKVVLPTTPRDAKGLLTAAIRDDNPVICIEHRWLYWAKADVPPEPFAIPIGEANILRHGIEVEVIDPRTIAPFNDTMIVESVTRTGHCIVADNDWVDCGFSAEVAARVSEKCFGKLKSPVTRIGFAFAPCPTVRVLENEFYPNAATIVRAVEKKLGLPALDLSDDDFYSHERRFTGPF